MLEPVLILIMLPVMVHRDLEAVVYGGVMMEERPSILLMVQTQVNLIVGTGHLTMP